MTAIEIINLIISILSLLATVAISFVIYFLEKRNVKMKLEHDVKEAAKRFIIDNAEEIGYLPYAVIASECFPQNKHCRKIYNEFTMLDNLVKEQVLKQAKMDIPLIKGDEWIDEKISLVKEAAKQLDLGDAFLYDGAKYFHRLYDQKEREYSDSTHGYWAESYKDVFGLHRIFFNKKKGYIPFSRYIDDYLYFKYEKTEDFSKEWIKPFDYMLSVMQIRETSDEGLVCCWVSHIIEETICYAVKYLNYANEKHITTDSFPETFEDRYFQILYKLYFFIPNNGKKSGPTN